MFGVSKVKISFSFLFSFRYRNLLDVFDTFLNKVLRVDLALMRLWVLISGINLFSDNVDDGVLKLGKLLALNSVGLLFALLEDQKVWSYLRRNPFVVVQEYVEIPKWDHVLSVDFLCDVCETPQHLPTNRTGLLLRVEVHDLDWCFKGQKGIKVFSHQFSARLKHLSRLFFRSIERRQFLTCKIRLEVVNILILKSQITYIWLSCPWLRVHT